MNDNDVNTSIWRFTVPVVMAVLTFAASTFTALSSSGANHMHQHCVDVGVKVPGVDCFMAINADMDSVYGTQSLSAPPAMANGAVQPDWGGAPGADPFPAVCSGTGKDGPRIEAVYVYDKTRTNHAANLQANIRATMNETDRVTYLSSARFGATSARRLRLATEPDPSSPKGCRPTVGTLAVDHGFFDGTDLAQIIWALKDAGRWGASSTQGLISVLFIDDRDQSAGQCGWAGLALNDARNGPNALADQRFGVVYANCWTTAAVTHELMHNLGAVQMSAPNSTGAGHCNDGADILCYQDGGPKGQQRTACAPGVYRFAMLDCNGDDYLNTNPAPGSYLAEHFNVADSPFVQTATLPATAPPNITQVTAASGVTYPYIGVPFSFQAGTPGGLAVAGSTTGKASYGMCNVMPASVPSRGATSATVSGVMSCSRNPGVTGVPVVAVDLLGRDTTARVGINWAFKQAPLHAQWQTEAQVIGRKWHVTAKLVGRLPNAAAFNAPLIGADVAVYDQSTGAPVAQNFTDANGAFTFDIPLTAAAKQFELVSFAEAWTVAPYHFTSPSATSASQTITFTALGAGLVKGSKVELTAWATSGLSVQLDAQTPQTCAVVAGKLTLLAPGWCRVSASQPGGGRTSAALPVIQSVWVKNTQQLTVTAPTSAKAGTTATVDAKATSNLAVAVTSSTPSVCTVVTKTVTFITAGSCTLSFAQRGDATFASALKKNVIIAVTR